jgi:flap endonuclease-1
MGLQFKDLVVKKEITLRELQGKILAVDAYNLLYQFLTSIRGPDGTVLTDGEGRVTSHLIGLFNRTTSLMEEGIKLVFVFDGKPPEIKRRTWEKRTAIKKAAAAKLQEAEEAGDVDSMKKFAARTARLDREMLEDAKKVITALGLPIVQAPSEGEAQAAFMVRQGDAYAVVSQDYDNLIFNAPRMIKNLSIAGKRKKTGQFGYITVKPELLETQKVLEHLGLTHEQLVVLAILVGTDYNPGGIKGIGPKKALKLVREKSVEEVFSEVKWSESYPDISWKEIYDTITKMPVTHEYSLEWHSFDEEKIKKLLLDDYGFSADRVLNKLNKLKERKGELSQKRLGKFF